MKKTFDLLFKDCETREQKVCMGIVLLVMLSIIPGVIAEYSVACAVLSIGYEVAGLGWIVNFVDKYCKEEDE